MRSLSILLFCTSVIQLILLYLQLSVRVTFSVSLDDEFTVILSSFPHEILSYSFNF